MQAWETQDQTMTWPVAAPLERCAELLWLRLPPCLRRRPMWSRICGLLLAPLFVLGSLEFVGPFEPPGLEASRHAGAAGLHQLVPMLLAVGVGLLVTA